MVLLVISVLQIIFGCSKKRVHYQKPTWYSLEAVILIMLKNICVGLKIATSKTEM